MKSDEQRITSVRKKALTEKQHHLFGRFRKERRLYSDQSVCHLHDSSNSAFVKTDSFSSLQLVSL